MKKDDERAGNRVERVPLHKQKLFTAEQRPGYKRRWVNEGIGVVDAFLRAGWTLVQGDDLSSTHDGLSHVESNMGSVMRRVVNKDPRASIRTAVLMEIPIEWFEAAKKEQQQLIDESEAAFDANGVHRQTNMYGSMSRSYENVGGKK